MSFIFSSCKMGIILPAFQRTNIYRRVCVMPAHHGYLIGGNSNYDMRSFKLLSPGPGSVCPLPTITAPLLGGRSSLGCIWTGGQYKILKWPAKPLPHPSGSQRVGPMEMQLIPSSATPGHCGRIFSRWLRIGRHGAENLVCFKCTKQDSGKK